MTRGPSFHGKGMMYLVVLCFLIPPQLRPQGSFSALEIPYHVRSLSMSATGVADAMGMDISGTNPALLFSGSGGPGGGSALLLSLIRYPAQVQSEMVEWRLPLGRGRGAVSVRHVGYGVFDDRDEGGVKTGQFSAGDTWFSVALAQRMLTRVDVGATGGFFFSQIEDVTATLGLLTLGTALHIPQIDATLGLSVRNLGVTLNSYTAYKEVIPTSLNLGATKKLAHLPLTISLDGVWWHGEDRSRVRMGGEFVFPYGIFLRWGVSSYRFDQKTNNLWRDVATGTSLGLAYRSRNLTMDVGLQYTGVAGTAIGIGVSTSL
ncbi:MAG: hypothetical protein ACE5GH_03625 [Fidelibacterota bacterium]